MLGSRVAPVLLAIAGLLTGCATESHQAIAVDPAPYPPYEGERSPIAVGRFNNSSTYMRGIFSEGPDRLGNQAKTILQTHLAMTGRFRVLDRGNMGQLSTESDLAGAEQDHLTGGGGNVHQG